MDFFKGMTNSQTIEFLRLFDIFVVGFHNEINAYVEMTADPSSLNFEKTLRISISKSYTQFSQNFSRRATPSIEGDLRDSIGSTPVQLAGFSTSLASGVRDSSVENGLSNFGPSFRPFQGFEGPATQPVSQFQWFGEQPSGFSQFSAQSPSFGGYFQPIAKGDSTNPFTSQVDFVFVQPTDGVVSRQSQTRLEIRKGRVIRVEIPSDCSSGPTVGITKSPKAKTPIATTIANLEKKIARLEMENPMEGSPDYLTLVVSRAKLEKIRNSL